MKDGRTHLAHKAEHAIDLETGAATVEGGEAERLAAFRQTRDALAETFREFIDRLGSPTAAQD
jgi:hypothetical protein